MRLLDTSILLLLLESLDKINNKSLGIRGNERLLSLIYLLRLHNVGTLNHRINTTNLV